MELLKIQHIEKYYGSRQNVTKALDDVSFDVQKGEYIGIREIRKHAAWYTAGYPNSSRLRGQINEVENYDQLKQLFAAMVRMGKR